jgi:hypothetical protein
VPVHRTYTPELLASGRHRYENTPEPVASIAADFGIQPYSLRRLAKNKGWVRYQFAPRDLPVARRLLAQAEALESEALKSEALEADRASAEASAQPPEGADNRSAIDRIEQAVRAEIAAIEASRARLKNLPRRPYEAERTARTLSTLTDTLQKINRLRCGGRDARDDDLPENIDELRRELARRIHAFVESHEAAQETARQTGQAVWWKEGKRNVAPPADDAGPEPPPAVQPDERKAPRPEPIYPRVRFL